MKELQTLNQVSWPNPELEIPNILFCLEYDGFLCVRISRAVNRKSIALESTVKVEQNTHKEYMINARASDPRKSSAAMNSLFWTRDSEVLSPASDNADSRLTSTEV